MVLIYHLPRMKEIFKCFKAGFWTKLRNYVTKLRRDSEAKGRMANQSAHGSVIFPANQRAERTSIPYTCFSVPSPSPPLLCNLILFPCGSKQRQPCNINDHPTTITIFSLSFVFCHFPHFCPKRR